MTTNANEPADELAQDLELCKRTAHILGEQSGAAKALAEYDRLRAEGRNPFLFGDRGRWVVCYEPAAGEPT